MKTFLFYTTTILFFCFAAVSSVPLTSSEHSSLLQPDMIEWYNPLTPPTDPLELEGEGPGLFGGDDDTQQTTVSEEINLDAFLEAAMSVILDENAELIGSDANILEGDILTTEDQSLRKRRNALLDSTKLWPNAKIPYVIDSTFGSAAKHRIEIAILQFDQHTCVRFVPRTTEADYVNILNTDGCSSHVGKRGGGQTLTLGGSCTNFIHVIIHEFIHAAGFYHEQSRPDRDAYIIIAEENVEPGKLHNFNKLSSTVVTDLGVPYEYGSVMHYAKDAFSVNGLDTIIPVTAGAKLGNDYFSSKDVYKLNKLYDCSCRDSNVNCAHWASIGECQNNPLWMLPNCQRSCDQCSYPTECEDNICLYWKDQGYCDPNNVNYAYASQYCRKTCASCQECKDAPDYVSFCAAWESVGFCESNSIYYPFMQQNCALTCGFCTAGSCIDEDINCPQWSAAGLCAPSSSYYTFVSFYCRKSCSFCEV